MTLQSPLWLLLVLPLGAALWAWRPASWLLFGLRVASMLLVVLALAGLALVLPSRTGTVVLVVDRSLSMPHGSDARNATAVRLVAAAMGGDDQLRVVSFGRKAALEPMRQGQQFPGFVSEVGEDGSALGEAVEMALGLVPPGAPGRLVLLTDGKWTGRAPTTLAAVALSRGIAIDYRCEERPPAGDLAIARVDAPSQVAVGESFFLTAWVLAPGAGQASYQLRRGEQVIAKGKFDLKPGLNRLTRRDRALEAGAQEYTLVVTGPGEDPVPENNTARLLVGVEGPKPVLHFAGREESGLHELLKRGGLDVRLAPAGKARLSLEVLSRYSAVLLEDVPAERLGEEGLEALAAWVREAGGGLFMTGGKSSYGTGGYYKSPLEPVLPVSMELRNEHRKLAMAIVVALDRSGSMTAPVGGGRQKMDLANLGAAQVLDLMGPNDEFGCLAVDTVAHTIAPLGRVTARAKTRSDILRIRSMGGGIFVYTALAKSAEMLLGAKSGTKHIILFADANDAEEPGDYKNLVAKCRRAGITVSVIGLGTTRDKDAALLEDIAKLGKGRVFFTDKAEELPRLFAQDTFVVARNTFIDTPTPVSHLPGLRSIIDQDLPAPRGLAVGGFNLCYLRPEATLGSVTLKPARGENYSAPVVAAWQAGTGRVVCYTGEADGKYAGNVPGWKKAGEFFTSLARYAAGKAGPLGDGMQLTQQVREGTNRLTLHLDPERKGEPFARLPAVRLLRSKLGRPPTVEKTALRWSGPDTLTAEVPLAADETLLAAVDVPGQKPVSLPPVCLPYSPEFKPPGEGRGLPALEMLAEGTGGVERADLTAVWRDLPRKPQLIPLAMWLLLAAVVLWLLEVLDRRTGLLSDLLRRRAAVAAGAAAESAAGTERPAEVVRPAASRPVPAPAQLAGPAPPAPPAPEVAQDTGLLEALRKARQKSRGN